MILTMTRGKLWRGRPDRNTSPVESISHSPMTYDFCSGYFQGLEEGQGPCGQEVALDAGHSWEGCPAASQSSPGLSLWHPHLGAASSASACAHWEPPCWNPFVHPQLQHSREQLWGRDFTSHCSCTTAVCSSLWAQWGKKSWQTFMEGSVWKQCRAGIRACFHKDSPATWIISTRWRGGKRAFNLKNVLYKEQNWQRSKEFE